MGISPSLGLCLHMVSLHGKEYQATNSFRKVDVNIILSDITFNNILIINFYRPIHS